MWWAQNVDDAANNMDEGHRQLQRLWRNTKSNRGLMLRVFAVLFFFIVVYGTLFA